MIAPVEVLEAFRYIPLLRPASSATLPRALGWEYVEAPWDLAHRRPDLPRSAHRHGLIAVSRPLTAEECESFDLRPFPLRSPHVDCLYHITPARNLAAIAADGLVPQIGLRSRRAGENTPFVHCFSSFDELEAALAEGMAEEFGEGEKLAILVVNLKAQGHSPDGCAFGVTIGTHLLWVLTDEIGADPDYAALRRHECTMLGDYIGLSTALTDQTDNIPAR